MLLVHDSAIFGHPHSVTRRAGRVRCRTTRSLRWTSGWIFCSRFANWADRAQREIRDFVWGLDSNRFRRPWVFAGFALVQTAVGGWLDDSRRPRRRRHSASLQMFQAPHPGRSSVSLPFPASGTGGLPSAVPPGLFLRLSFVVRTAEGGGPAFRL